MVREEFRSESELVVPHVIFSWLSQNHFSGLLLLLIVIFVRLCIGTCSYSGEGKPPMFGDYEAQRHWMEVTVNLPISDWYMDTIDNDLQYWGLDYPPLTAYVSWMFGKIAQIVQPGLVALHESRGFESYNSKIFMRMTVLFSDIICFIFPAWRFAHHRRTWNDGANHFLLITLCPLFVIIDHGHFQYNCISLGLLLLAFYQCQKDRLFFGSFLYVSSFMFKQISLYYSLAFAAFAIGKCFQNRSFLGGIVRAVLLLIFGISSIGVFFLPWIPNLEACLQVIHRMFPFARGLYEDKVSNFWCATSIFIKWRRIFGQKMPLIAMFTTIIASIPSLLPLFRHPSTRQFTFALTISSLCFFLFGFQVHEKSIMFPLLPASFLASESPGIFGITSYVAMFSMFTLLEKDGLAVPYVILQIIYLAYCYWAQVSIFQDAAYIQKFIIYAGMIVVIPGSIMIHLLSGIHWSERYPDIGAFLYVIWSCAYFLAMYLYLVGAQWDSLKNELLEKSNEQNKKLS